jgi:hypothetical protein
VKILCTAAKKEPLSQRRRCEISTRSVLGPIKQTKIQIRFDCLQGREEKKGRTWSATSVAAYADLT